MDWVKILWAVWIVAVIACLVVFVASVWTVTPWGEKSPSSSCPPCSVAGGPGCPSCPAEVPITSVAILSKSLGGFCTAVGSTCQAGVNGYAPDNKSCDSAPQPTPTVGSTNTVVNVNGTDVLSISDGGTRVTVLSGGQPVSTVFDPTLYATGCLSWQLGSWLGSVLVSVNATTGQLFYEYAVFNAANPSSGRPTSETVPAGCFGNGVFQTWSPTNPNGGDGANFGLWVDYALNAPSDLKRVALVFVLSGSQNELAVPGGPESGATLQGLLVGTRLNQLLCPIPSPTCPYSQWNSLAPNTGYCAVYDFATSTLHESLSMVSAPDQVVSLVSTLSW